MTNSKINEIQEILTEADGELRLKLKALGVKISHVLLAISPNGAGIVRSNVGSEDLREMAELLADAADQAEQKRLEHEPLN